MPLTPDSPRAQLLDVVDQLQELAAQVERLHPRSLVPPSLAEFARAWKPGAFKPLRVCASLGQQPTPPPVDPVMEAKRTRDEEAYQRRVAAEAAELARKETLYQKRPETVGRPA